MARFSEAAADPDGTVVALVGVARPELSSELVADAVFAVAPARTARRRLAQGLVGRPGILDDGRSPAPRVAGEFLLELRRRGAMVSAPVCARCAKELSSLCRRGEDWVCHSCAVRRAACTDCGKMLQVSWVDREGQPHCSSCPPVEEDPTSIVLGVVRNADPTLTPEVVRATLDAVAPRTGVRRKLAWAIEDRPELLTGAGAETPDPVVLRFIDELWTAGSTAVVRPGCPFCGRVVRLSGDWEGRRICRGCEARRRREPCAACGRLRPPAGRDDDGKVLCGNCFSRAPVNHEVCVGCGRRRRVCVRDADGPRCDSCRPLTEATCSICGEFRACETSRLTGQPWCRACQKRRFPCTGCGRVRLVRSGTLAAPRCGPCTDTGPSLLKACPACGEASKLVEGPCERCGIAQRLDEVLTGASGQIMAPLVKLRDSMLEVRPETTLEWLRKPAVSGMLADLGSGRLALSHDALDALALGKPVEHLRSVLVSTGALPARDEHMVRLERWVADTVASRPGAEEQQLLRRYALWHLVRRLRRRHRGADTTYGQFVTVKRHVRGAMNLLDWLRAGQLTLANAGQGDLEAWIGQVGPARASDAGNFLRWAKAQRLTGLELAAVRWQGPSAGIDVDGRWEQARWLLREDSVERADRVAGLLVLLYAQRVSTIARLTLADVVATDEALRLRLGPHPIQVPEPLAGLLVGLVATRRGHAAVGELGGGEWLFPGGQPARPISASRLNERLRGLGIHSGPTRTAALMQLATELPAALIARMLGIHIQVAVQWQRLASGDWAAYAADYSRRAVPAQ